MTHLTRIYIQFFASAASFYEIKFLVVAVWINYERLNTVFVTIAICKYNRKADYRFREAQQESVFIFY